MNDKWQYEPHRQIKNYEKATNLKELYLTIKQNDKQRR